ncbi:MAG: hypothetical protein SGCHY_005273, partial [Lobulomycetales sp.]
ILAEAEESPPAPVQSGPAERAKRLAKRALGSDSNASQALEESVQQLLGGLASQSVSNLEYAKANDARIAAYKVGVGPLVRRCQRHSSKRLNKRGSSIDTIEISAGKGPPLSMNKRNTPGSHMPKL